MAIGDFQLQRGAGGNGSNAVRIPITTQRTAAQGQLNSKLSQIDMRTGADQVAQAGVNIGNAVQSFGRDLATVARYEQDKEEQRLKLEANNAYSQDSLNLGMWFNEANQNIQQGGKGFTKTINDQIDKNIETAVKDKPEVYKQEYTRHMLARKAQLVQQAQIGEIQEGARHKLTTINTDVQAVVGRLAADPSQSVYTSELDRLNKLVDSDQQLRVDVKDKVKENIKEQLSWATATKRAEQAAKSVPVGGQPAAPGGFDGAVSRVLKHEGGYAASDGNTGEPVIYGLNKKFNPEEFAEARRITKEDGTEAGKAYAAKVYREKYWNAIGGDNLPPALQATALDAAVNQGPAKAKQWIAESGGDVAKFNALRQAHYDKLAASGKYKDSDVASWNNRMKSFAGQELRDPTQPTDAPKQQTMSEILGAPFDNLSFDKQQQVAKYYEQQFKQGQASQTANVAIENAAAVVGAAPLEVGKSLDVPALKEQAVARVEAVVGKLEATQRLQVETAVEKQVADKERDFKRSVDNDMAAGFDILRKNGGDYQALVRDQPALVQRVGPAGAQKFNEYAGVEATGGNRATDWQAYNALISDPKTLASTNLNALSDKFNAREFQQLQQLQQKIQTNPQAQDNIMGDKALVDSMLKTSGVRDDKKEAQFYSLLQQAIDQELAATGKKALTQERKKELAADLLVQEITKKGTLWDSKEKAFLIEIPPAEKIKIELALQENGMPVTDYNVLRAYRNKLNRPSVLQSKPQ